MESNIKNNSLAEDLDFMTDRIGGNWQELRGKRIFLTGGTGFFGRWFLESFAWANSKFSLGASVLVLTRDADSFKRAIPHLAANEAISFLVGDINSFDFPEGEFPFIIHAAATSAVETFNGADSLSKFNTVVGGTRRVLDFALQARTEKMLFVSSGAVYGEQPENLTNIPEDYLGAPDPTNPDSVWGESKRAAELLCSLYASKSDLEIKVARCFSFVGPYLPEDIHYAIGNFIRDGAAGGPIEIKGDGTPLRSYLYASDLMVWLWMILFAGKSCHAYNVGSERGLSIAEIAEIVVKCYGKNIEVKRAKSPVAGQSQQRYVPQTRRAAIELGLTQTISIEEGIKRTIAFNNIDYSGHNNMEEINAIFNRTNGSAAKPLIIFEMANNHMGDVNHGLEIIRQFYKVSRNFAEFSFAFKFQYRHLPTFIHPDYQGRMDLKYVKRFSETALGDADLLSLKKEAENLGFITICTPFDEPSVDRIVSHGYDIIKIASCSVCDWPLLETIANADKPIIFSVGGAALANIDSMVSFFQHRQKKIAILHCVGQYPTLAEHLQLNQIDLLRARYEDVVIGFSSHEEPDNFESIKIAAAKGASIFEKHVGVKSDKYDLNAYSINPEQAQSWLESLRQAMDMCGVYGCRHEFAEKELADIRQFQRGVFAKHDIKPGDRIDSNDVFFAFPNRAGQLVANELSKYKVLTANIDIRANEPIFSADAAIEDVREKVYQAITKVNELFLRAKMPFSNKWDFELSHHYGLDKFYEYGASIASCINREYCKKLLIVLPGQKHPAHYHKVKEETFSVLYGKITFILNGKRIECQAGDIVTVERGVNHAFEVAPEDEGCIFEEVSTTHIPGDSYYEDPAVLLNKNRKTSLTYWVI